MSQVYRLEGILSTGIFVQLKAQSLSAGNKDITLIEHDLLVCKFFSPGDIREHYFKNPEAV